MAKWGKYAPLWHQMYPICPDDPRITPWGCIKDLMCTALKWWRGNLGTRHNPIQESRLCQRVWIWLNESREAPRSIRTKWNQSSTWRVSHNRGWSSVGWSSVRNVRSRFICGTIELKFRGEVHDSLIFNMNGEDRIWSFGRSSFNPRTKPLFWWVF